MVEHYRLYIRDGEVLFFPKNVFKFFLKKLFFRKIVSFGVSEYQKSSMDQGMGKCFFPKKLFSFFEKKRFFRKIVFFFNFFFQIIITYLVIQIKVIIFVLCPRQDVIAASRSSCPLSFQ